MLNISTKTVGNKVDLSMFKSGEKVFRERRYTLFNRFLIAFSICLVIIAFLPWTQNVSGAGYVTTLNPEHRPQTVQSVIPGRIEEWYVQEGDFVEKGDTIMQISEIKSEYFDPLLVERTDQQLKAKAGSVISYSGKIGALNKQLVAINAEKILKIQQAQNKLDQVMYKVESDSIELVAAKTNLEVAQTQYRRTLQLQEEGLKALPEVEEKRLKLQETQAKLNARENRLLASRSEVINARLDIDRTSAEYEEKLSKTESEMETARSNQFDAEAQKSKLENDLANYEIRRLMEFVLAPQNGYVNKALRGGIGETFKEGERLVSIMPSQFELAVETYVKPIDVPLLRLGHQVRVQFDGWPAIVFSGWEGLSYGTYGATIVAIDNFISENGKYRVLLAPDANDHPWPKGIRIGSGATTLALLKDVPIWYELWRNLNGFPPDFYNPESKSITEEE